ncbi:MAG: transposase, partial [Candidatus Dormibacteria bacterium]
MALPRKTFRPYDQNQQLLLPPDLAEWVPAGHLARLVSKLLLYGYATGIYSSRRLEKADQELVPCRYLTADQQPDHWTISEFRRRHLPALPGLFRQVLQLCQEAGLVQLGHVALDGTKIEANASKHKAMSYARMRDRGEEYARIVAGWLKQA